MSIVENYFLHEHLPLLVPFPPQPSTFLSSCNVLCSHEHQLYESCDIHHGPWSQTLHLLSDPSMCLSAAVADAVSTEFFIFLITVSARPGLQVLNHLRCRNRIPIIHLCTIFYLHHEMSLLLNSQKGKLQKIQRYCFGFIGDSGISNIKSLEMEYMSQWVEQYKVIP